MSESGEVLKAKGTAEVEAGAGARVIREIIRTPVFQEIIKANASSLSPEYARQMVRTLLWEDAGLSLGMMGASPAVFNYVIEAVLELGRQLGRFPDEMLSEFLSQMSSDIGPGRLKELPEVYGPVLERAVLSSPVFREKLTAGFINGVNVAVRASVVLMARVEEMSEAAPVDGRPSIDAAAIGQALTAAARLVNRSASRNPYFLRDVAENVDVKEVALAAASLARSLVVSTFRMIRRLAGLLVDNLAKIIG